MSTIYIGFNDTGSTTGINYYPTARSYDEPTRLTLVDDAGSNTQIEMSSSGGGSISPGTSSAAGINLPQFPDEIEANYFYTDSDALETYVFYNMPAGTHTLEIFASRGATGGREGVYDFGSDSGTLDAAENTTNTLTLTHTATEGENVTFSFTRNTANTYGYLNAAILTTASGPSIAQADTTPEDGVQQTVTCSGMTGPITAATLAGKDILYLLSDTDPSVAITYTLDISTTETSEGQPRVGETSTLSFTTATDGAVTTDVVIQPKTGWARSVMAGTLNKDANGFLASVEADFGVTVSVPDIIYYNAENNANITAQGVYTSDLTSEGQFTELILQQGGSATTTATSEGGAFFPYGDVAGSGRAHFIKKLTSKKLTAKKLRGYKL